MLVLALESSTSSAKAMLYDTQRGVLDTVTTRYPSSCSRNGVSDTEAIFNLTMEAGRRVAAGKEVAAVALCCIWHSVAVCDLKMRPGNTYSWNWLAPSKLCREARKDALLTDKFYQRTGCVPHVIYVRQMLRYLRENGICLKEKRLPSQGAYTFFQLTGEFLESANVMSGTGLLNTGACKYDDFALEYAGIDSEQLGELGDYQTIRPLSARGAEWLGIQAGIPVVPAHADGALNQIAAGAAQVGRMTLSVGTSGAIRMATAQPVLPKGHELWCYRGVTDWMSGAATNGACNCLDWFRETVLGGKIAFSTLDAEEIPLENLPVFLPFLFGERNPGWRDERKGGFVDLRPEHGIREMYRAIQLGVLFHLYQCYEVLIKNVGAPQMICASGGILYSPRWTQLLADVFGTSIHCVKDVAASTVGAAVLAMHAAGAIEDVRMFDRDVQNATVVAPRIEGVERCAALYQRYLEYYNRT